MIVAHHSLVSLNWHTAATRAQQAVDSLNRAGGADEVDPLRGSVPDRHSVSGARERILALAGTADPIGAGQNREQAGPAGRGRTIEADRDRSLKAIQKQITAMGGEYFDLLIQKVSGVTLLRTWSVNEIERLTGWLKRMNVRGHDVLIRPAGKHGLVLVNALSVEEIERLQSSPLAAAAVIETRPGQHQAWVKLSDQAIPPRVRTMVGDSVEEKRHNNAEHGGQNAYGYLAGFTNHS